MHARRSVRPRAPSARALLERAQLQLEAGAYAEAREYAIEARKEALRARDQADNPQLRP